MSRFVARLLLAPVGPGDQGEACLAPTDGGAMVTTNNMRLCTAGRWITQKV